MAAGISALGVRIVGDVAALSSTPPRAEDRGPDFPEAFPALPAPAAAQAVLGVILASKIPDAMAAGKTSQASPLANRGQPARTEDRRVREVDSKTLARVLAGRARRRIRRTIWRARRDPPRRSQPQPG